MARAVAVRARLVREGAGKGLAWRAGMGNVEVPGAPRVPAKKNDPLERPPKIFMSPPEPTVADSAEEPWPAWDGFGWG